MAETASVLARPLRPVGELFAFALDVLAGIFERPFQWREFFDQSWFVTRVSLLPICAITIPFGAVLSLQIGSLFNQLGARSFTGAVAVVGIVQQAAPVATVASSPAPPGRRSPPTSAPARSARSSTPWRCSGSR